VNLTGWVAILVKPILPFLHYFFKEKLPVMKVFITFQDVENYILLTLFENLRLQTLYVRCRCSFIFWHDLLNRKLQKQYHHTLHK